MARGRYPQGMSLGAIVAAAGSGTRFGGEKTLALLLGRPLLCVTVDRLRRLPGLGGIVVVLAPDRLPAVRAEWGAALAAGGRVEFAPGGARRQDSVRNGLAALPPEVDLVLVHDAVRPLFSVPAAERAVAVARESGAAVVGVPARDTLKAVGEGGVVRGTLPRDEVWHAETPQVFRRSVLAEAFRRAEEDSFAATDEASLVEHAGGRVAMVRGTPWNVKVTERSDLAVVTALLGKEGERWRS